MSDRANVIYEYDGSFDGLLCCVFDSYDRREIPMEIRPAGEPELSLFPVHEVVTVPEHAERVFVSVGTKIGSEAADLVNRAFLYGMEGKELAILRFLRMGYQHGSKTVRMLGEGAVSDVQHMVQSVGNECHLLLGFLRFSEVNGGLVAVIEPKHYVLPLMVDHFRKRYAEEQFLIFDKTHHMALVYQPYEWKIIPVEHFELPGEEQAEQDYQRLWKGYYDAIGIQARENPRCRMSHMPKRFWPHLTEMQPLCERRSLEGNELSDGS